MNLTRRQKEALLDLYLTGSIYSAKPATILSLDQRYFITYDRSKHAWTLTGMGRQTAITLSSRVTA
jgi:hypothetical protein